MAKKMYIGRISQVPIYEQQLVDVPKTVKATPQNNAEFFNTSGSSGGRWYDGEFRLTNGTTTASTRATLIVLKKMTVSFTVKYDGGYTDDTEYPGEDSQCRVTVNGVPIVNSTNNAVSQPWSGELLPRQTIEVYSKTGSSAIEQVSLEKFAVTYTTKEPQQVQVGEETRAAARRVRRQYVGVDGKARKVRKGYVGVNGKARLFFLNGSELLPVKRQLSPLTTAKSQHAAASVGKYAVFAGGMGVRDNTNYLATTDAYDSGLTHTNPQNLGKARRWLAATNVGGKYAVFGGGGAGNKTNYTDAYDGSLTKASISALSGDGRYNLAATGVGKYGLFGGGYYIWFGDKYQSTVDAYDDALTRTTAASLSSAKDNVSAASTKSYAFFAGGRGTTAVDAYDTNLTRTSAAPLRSGKTLAAAAGIAGDYVFFAGGSGADASTQVEVYDDHLTRVAALILPQGSWSQGAAGAGEMAVIAGGYSRTDKCTDAVYTIDSSLTLAASPLKLSVARGEVKGAIAGDYIVFAGGAGMEMFDPEPTQKSTVDAYKID